MLANATCLNDVKAVEARAHTMRAEFMRDLVRASGKWLRAHTFGHRGAKLA